MFVTQEALNREHLNSGMCRRGMERKQRTLLFEETEKHMGLVFLVYGKPLKAVSVFRYLGITLLSTEEDWSVVE